MRIRSESPMRQFVIPGVGPVSGIKFFHNGAVWYTTRSGWLEHQPETSLSPGGYMASAVDVKEIEIDTPKRARVENLNRSDNFYLKNGDGYALYIYMRPPGEPLRVQTRAGELDVSFAQRYLLPLRAILRDGTAVPSVVCLSHTGETVLTAFGECVQKMQRQLELDGIELGSSDVASILHRYHLQRLFPVTNVLYDENEGFSYPNLTDEQLAKLLAERVIYRVPSSSTVPRNVFGFVHSFKQQHGSGWFLKLTTVLGITPDRVRM